jgi:hypothetical protein
VLKPGLPVTSAPAVALALDAAASPVRCGDLAGKLAAEFPATPPEKINRLTVELVAHRVLVSALRAPSTITDTLGHLLVACRRRRPAARCATSCLVTSRW